MKTLSQTIVLGGTRIKVELREDGHVTTSIVPPETVLTRFRRFHTTHPEVLAQFVRIAVTHRSELRARSRRHWQPRMSAAAVLDLVRREHPTPGMRNEYAAIYSRFAALVERKLCGAFECRRECCVSDSDLQDLLNKHHK